MLRKKQLEIILSRLKDIPNPRADLEQYSIPSNLAAEMLNIAFLNGDISGKKILDFGCGTGKLGIGAVLMGAKQVMGIDVDGRILNTARTNVEIAENLSGSNIHDRIEFVEMNVMDWTGKGDTVMQNPPFGIRSSGLDLLFLKKALESGKKIYSLHRGPIARRFLKDFIEKNNGKVENIIELKFKIPYMFKFHKKPKVIVDVDLYVIKRKG